MTLREATLIQPTSRLLHPLTGSIASSYTFPSVQSPSQDYCFDVTATEPETAEDCICFARDRGYQNRSGGYSCNIIASSVPISLTQLLAWNPWLGASSASNTDCTKALFANLDYYENPAVCIRTGGARPTVTSTTAQATVSPSPARNSGPLAPTQTGVVEGCQQFHVV
ncbi:hypothetical protein C8A01DRAFT_35557 [Parachaetomium inaequale]|uniref:LysM domain-containing protein n=1 Tax=Parachaetomium inaequale TaxID=2588326 RepID=A0AAN6SRH2_9PEZI|nr:hypothetical protein C8A01DRAFT_35557 [Parachaetomium inaequale]